VDADTDRPNGVLAAIAIVLLWLAGVAFFVAFEGAGILGESMPATGGGGVSYLKAALKGLTASTQTLQEGSQGES
jgi:hypothetical protein